MATRLAADPDRRSLSLAKGSRQAIVSAGGVALQRSKGRTDVPWEQLSQLQVTRMPLWPSRAWVDVFTLSGDHRIGLFSRKKAAIWAAAAGAAARDAGFATYDIADTDGFAVRPSG